MHFASRRKFSLDGDWGFEIDRYDRGTQHRVWECRREDPEGGPRDIDVGAFRQMHVPSDWNRQYSELAHYEGIAWYHTPVERPAGWAGRRAFLHFEGVNYHATIYWNGEELGSHEGGFTPFCFEVTGRIKAKNELVVRVDDARAPDRIPGEAFDWFRYGGILRSVWLVLAPRVYVKDFTVSTKLAKKGGEATVEFEVVGAKVGARARVILPQLKREIETKVGANGRARAVVDLENVHLWTPGHPHLYRIEIACEGDRIADEVGFRTIESKGGEILLNGKPIFLRGVCLHEESPRTAGRTLNQRDIDYIFKTARALGTNFLRLAHYPHSEAFVRQADRNGVLLWEEIPLWGEIDFKNKRTVSVAKTMLTEMIERDRNRACVIMWSIANETPKGPDRTRALKQLDQLAKKLDPTRPTSAAMFAELKGKTFTIKDPLSKVVDVVGVNQYAGWYEGKASDVASLRWKSTAGRPVILSEFGGGAKSGVRGKPTERWTEDHQVDIYRGQLDMIEKIKFARGACPWVLFDFRSSCRMNRHQQGYNRKGLLSDQGARKEAFQLVKERYEVWRKKWDVK